MNSAQKLLLWLAALTLSLFMVFYAAKLTFQAIGFETQIQRAEANNAK